MPVDPVPRRQKGGEAPLLGWLDLLAQSGERGAPQPPEHLDVAPLALAATQPQLSANEIAGALQLQQHFIDVNTMVTRFVRKGLGPRGGPELGRGGAHGAGVTSEQLLGRKRPVRARVACDELAQRVGHVGEERVGKPAWRHGAERVTVEPGVVGGDPALLTAEAQRHGAPFALKLVEQRA